MSTSGLKRATNCFKNQKTHDPWTPWNYFYIESELWLSIEPPKKSYIDILPSTSHWWPAGTMPRHATSVASLWRRCTTVGWLGSFFGVNLDTPNPTPQEMNENTQWKTILISEKHRCWQSDRNCSKPQVFCLSSFFFLGALPNPEAFGSFLAAWVAIKCPV